jgi:hypothetical protein
MFLNPFSVWWGFGDIESWAAQPNKRPAEKQKATAAATEIPNILIKSNEKFILCSPFVFSSNINFPVFNNHLKIKSDATFSSFEGTVAQYPGGVPLEISRPLLYIIR